MEYAFIASFLGAFIGSVLYELFTSSKKRKKIEPLETNLTRHLYIEPKERRKSVYRDKEIVKEEEG